MIDDCYMKSGGYSVPHLSQKHNPLVSANDKNRRGNIDDYPEFHYG